VRSPLSNTLPVIVAIVVLHNIAVTLGEDQPDDDEELQQYIAEKRLTLQTDNGNRSAVDAELHTAPATQTSYSSATSSYQHLLHLTSID